MPPRKRARGDGGGGASVAVASRTRVEIAVGDEGTDLDTGILPSWRAAHAVLSKLSQLRKDGTLTDVVVRTAGGEEFNAHRCVLVASCDYFGRLFASGMCDADTDMVTLNDVPAPVFSSILDFVYDGVCHVEDSALTDLLEAAARLQALLLQSATERAIKSKLLCAETAIRLWALADRLILPSLVAATMEVARGEFQVLASRDELLEVSPAMLSALLQLELSVDGEETVFGVVVRWADAAKPDEEALIEVLRHVRFGSMSKDFITQVVRAWPPMATRPGQGILVDALTALCTGGTPPKKRCPAIVWRTFDANLKLSTGSEGETIFGRERSLGWDVALGTQPLTQGCHEWVVNFTMNYLAVIGVATEDCEKDGDCPWDSGAWAFSPEGGREAFSPEGGREACLLCCAGATIAPSWSPPNIPEGALSIRVVLDMNARTLSFACGNDKPHLAYTHLPATVYPYVCSGDVGENCRVRQ